MIESKLFLRICFFIRRIPVALVRHPCVRFFPVLGRFPSPEPVWFADWTTDWLLAVPRLNIIQTNNLIRCTGVCFC